MSSALFILDACTLINLMNIDIDGFLFKKLFKYNLCIAESVSNEVKKNALKKLNLLKQYHISFDKNKSKEIEQITSQLYKLIIPDDQIKKDAGSIFNETINFLPSVIDNGEFFSSILALIKCREENQKIVFYTDDYPAALTLNDWINYQQIGSIQDSVDLLIFLFWSSDSFSRAELIEYLSLLHYEYAIEFKLLVDEVRKSLDNIKTLKNKNLKALLQKLDYKLSELDLSEFRAMYSNILKLKRQFPHLSPLLNLFNNVLKLEGNNSNNIFFKIKRTREWLRKYEILKIN